MLVARAGFEDPESIGRPRGSPKASKAEVDEMARSLVG